MESDDLSHAATPLRTAMTATGAAWHRRSRTRGSRQQCVNDRTRPSRPVPEATSASDTVIPEGAICGLVHCEDREVALEVN